MGRKKQHSMGNGELASDNSEERQHVQPKSVRFVNVSLNDADQQWLAANLANAEQHMDEFYTYVEDEQLRVGVSYDYKSKRWNATCTSWVVGDSRYGVILSVRAKHPAAALFCLAYATGYKLADGWGGEVGEDSGLFG